MCGTKGKCESRKPGFVDIVQQAMNLFVFYVFVMNTNGHSFFFNSFIELSFSFQVLNLLLCAGAWEAWERGKKFSGEQKTSGVR